MSQKADRLANARKKLREHQSKSKCDISVVQNKTRAFPQIQQNSGQELFSNQKFLNPTNGINETSTQNDNAKLIESDQSNEKLLTSRNVIKEYDLNGTENPNDVIKMFITEKAVLTSEITRCKNLCRDRDLELEEMQARQQTVNKHLIHLEREYLAKQQQNEELTALLYKMETLNNAKEKTFEENNDYIVEIKNMLSREKFRNAELEKSLKEKVNELELNKVRLNQISDEVSLNSDSRIEMLTQTQFMYEQQIRDLQAMVQQLGADKEQTNLQYQNYVQHLNNEVTSLSEKVNQLSEENAKISLREKDLIDHISILEKQIQQTLARQKDYQYQGSSDGDTINKLQTQIEELEADQLVFKIKIKSQDDEISKLKDEINLNLKKIQEFEERALSLNSKKLLATIESDKVAASKALLQNEELKKQLEELQEKFVQLTNDKLELRERLDSEEYLNKEVRANNKSLQEELMQVNEKWQFKENEMIRLSHENNKLIKENEQYKILESNDIEIGKITVNLNNYHTDNSNIHNVKPRNCINHESYNKQCDEKSEINAIVMTNEQESLLVKEKFPESVATEKLQVRFTQLMKEVADLTDEKQRLEHLVLQLQGETETIGEYISLYQTQRRMLMQREYEKTSQLQRLTNERKELQQNILTLNNLVLYLANETNSTLHNTNTIGKNNKLRIEKGDVSNQVIEPLCSELSKLDSEEILSKIQNIIINIKENTKDIPALQNVDHCSCCSGKLETI